MAPARACAGRLAAQASARFRCRGAKRGPAAFFERDVPKLVQSRPRQPIYPASAVPNHMIAVAHATGLGTFALSESVMRQLSASTGRNAHNENVSAAAISHRDPDIAANGRYQMMYHG